MNHLQLYYQVPGIQNTSNYCSMSLSRYFKQLLTQYWVRLKKQNSSFKRLLITKWRLLLLCNNHYALILKIWQVLCNVFREYVSLCWSFSTGVLRQMFFVVFPKPSPSAPTAEVNCNTPCKQGVLWTPCITEGTESVRGWGSGMKQSWRAGAHQTRTGWERCGDQLSFWLCQEASPWNLHQEWDAACYYTESPSSNEV